MAAAASWCDELPKWARGKVRFRRGFPTILSCTQTQWIGGRGLVQRAPIQSPTVNRFDAAQMTAFAATAHLERIRALQLFTYPHPQSVRAIQELG